MRNARTLKSRIAAINKQIGALPGLVTLNIKTPEGKLEALPLEPIDAVIALVDEMARDGDDRTQFSELVPYSGHIVDVIPDDPEDLPAIQALRLFDGIQEREKSSMS